MGELISMKIVGICCDSTSCDGEIRLGEMDYHKGMRFYEDLAFGYGWTCWVGRLRRWYCPHHMPSPGHKMHSITRNQAAGRHR